MKAISPEHTKGNYGVPVDIQTVHMHRHFYIHLPRLGLKSILEQPGNRFQWSAIIMLVQAALITPVVSVIILSTGNWQPLWFAAPASVYASFVPILSGQELRWIKLVFFISCMTSVLIMIAAVIHGLIV
jgi:predicted membrane channel-forming protein YqfA (hemolysin III family)